MKERNRSNLDNEDTPKKEDDDTEIARIQNELYVSNQKYLKESSELRENLSSVMIEHGSVKTELKQLKLSMRDNGNSSTLAGKIEECLPKKQLLSSKNAVRKRILSRSDGVATSSDVEENVVSETKKKLCRFYQSKRCNKGNTCSYRHVPVVIVPVVIDMYL